MLYASIYVPYRMWLYNETVLGERGFSFRVRDVYTKRLRCWVDRIGGGGGGGGGVLVGVCWVASARKRERDLTAQKLQQHRSSSNNNNTTKTTVVVVTVWFAVLLGRNEEGAEVRFTNSQIQTAPS